MPLNEKKIIRIILEECQSVSDKPKGYREEITNVLTDIIRAESDHKTLGTNIQQKVSDKCNAAGRFLAEKQNESGISGDDEL